MEPSADPKSAGLSSAKPSRPRIETQPQVLLAAHGLRKSFGGQIVLDGVNLELRQGEVVLLRGENGSGKTTLLNILTGNLEPDAGTIKYSADDSPRTYRFPRRWWQELTPWDHFRPEFVATEGIGRTWQDIRLFHAQNLRDNIAVATPSQPGENPIMALVAPARVRRTEQEIREKADAMLARLGLAGREISSADKISLGQSKRVAIARAVAAGARILFLDEPLAGLDQSGTANVLSLLEFLVRDQAVTLVIVEHIFNQTHLHGLVTTDWLLDKGRIAVLPSQGRTALAGHSQFGWRSLFTRDGVAFIDEPLAQGAILTRIRPMERFDNTAKPILEIRNLVASRGSRTVVGLDDERAETGFNLELFDQEIVVLSAPNGWGKSTFLATICGLVPVVRGEILLAGELLNNLPVWRRVRLGVRMVPSDRNIFPNLSARDALRVAGKRDSASLLGSVADRPSSSLSGGQKQRLALLSQAGQASVRLRMFDEPFANLDLTAIAEAARDILSQPTGAVLIALPSATP
jgi:branched-chain amino acid transport system ATP-binding protein